MIQPPQKPNAEISKYLRTLIKKHRGDWFRMPIGIEHEGMYNSSHVFDSDGYHGHTLQSFFSRESTSALILGEPGSGKSFSLRARVVELAETNLAYENSEEPIPVFIDLKTYAGDLTKQLEELDSQIDLRTLIKAKRVEFLIDSFNEVREVYRTDGSIQRELEDWIGQTEGCRWLIASRTKDGLTFFRGGAFKLTLLKKDYVKNLEKVKRLKLSGFRQLEIMRLLRRPFFLSAFLNGRLEIPQGGSHPAKLILKILESFENDVKLELRVKLNLSKALEPLAMQSIETGNEVVERAKVIEAIADSHQWHRPLAEQAISLLVREGLFLEIDKYRIAFYHQTITELMAAQMLAREVEVCIDKILPTFHSPRWDGVINLIPYFLSDECAKRVHQLIFGTKDYSFSTKFVRGLKNPSSGVTYHLTRLKQESFGSDSESHQNVSQSVRFIPAGPEHAELLKQAAITESPYSNSALRALFNVVSEQFENSSFHEPELEIESAFRWLFCVRNELPKYSDFSAPFDAFGTPFPLNALERILTVCETSEDGCFFEPKVIAGQLGYTIQPYSYKQIKELFSKHVHCPAKLRAALLALADTFDDPEAIELMFEAVTDGLGDNKVRTDCQTSTCFDIYLKLRYGINERYHLSKLLKNCSTDLHCSFANAVKEDYLQGGGKFSISLINLLTILDPKWIDIRRSWIVELPEVFSTCLLASDEERRDEFWHQLDKLLQRDLDSLTNSELSALEFLQDADQDEAFLDDNRIAFVQRIVALDNPPLVGAILRKLRFKSFELAWEELLAYVQRITPEYMATSRETNYRSEYCIEFLTQHFSDSCRQQFLATANDPTSKIRNLIFQYWLPRYCDATIGDFTPECVDFAINRLRSQPGFALQNFLKTAEEVEQILVPFCSDTDEHFAMNLRSTLSELGAKFSRRFAVVGLEKLD